MVLRSRIIYAGLLLIPSFLSAPGCGGPPKPPEETENISIEDLQAGAVGVDLGVEESLPTEEQGEPSEEVPGADAPEDEEGTE